MDVRISRSGEWTADGAPVAVEPGRGLLGADVAFPVLHGPYGEDGVVQGSWRSSTSPMWALG